jgi:hypothetical protein
MKPKPNFDVEDFLIQQTIGYMCQAYKCNRNFHLNQISIKYLNKWNQIRSLEILDMI